MARADMIRELREMCYAVQELGDGCISFPFDVTVGRFVGQTVTVGLLVGEDWPFNPPSGPHISPSLLPINPAAIWPHGGIHGPLCRPFMAGGFQYWIRPHPNWADTKRSARDYIAHLNMVFDALA